MKACSINGRCVSGADASISVMDHGLLYGDGIFEGLRYYSGQVFRMTEHLERLEDSARAIALTLPYDRAWFVNETNRVIEEAGLDDGYIRLVVTRGKGSLGIDPRTCREPQVIIIADELQLMPAERVAAGIDVVIASTRRLGLAQLDPRIKSLNYLNNLLARLEANAAGADEAVLLNEAGHVAEGTADNIFVVKNGILTTPPATDGALLGITREVVLDIAKSLGIVVIEASLGPYDLFTADAVFLTGTGAELIPVKTVSGRELPVIGGEVYRRIACRFEQTVREHAA